MALDLKVESYCQNCSFFKPWAEKSYNPSYDGTEDTCDTIITCKGAEICRAIYDQIQKELTCPTKK